MTRLAEVVFPLPLSQSFLYLIPSKDLDAAKPGVRVQAPLGSKTLAGFIVRVQEQGLPGDIALKEIKEIIDEEPVVSPATLAFTRRLSGHFCSSWGEFLQATLPPSLEMKTSAKVRLTEKGKQAWQSKTLSKEEKKAADVLGSKTYTIFYLRRKTGVKSLPSLISRMDKKGLVQVFEERRKPKKKNVAFGRARPIQLELDFSADPSVHGAVEAMTRPLEENRFASFYLFGGRDARRAAYAPLIQRVLARMRQVLFLNPEVEMSGPWREFLGKRLGETAAFLNGQMSENARELEWQKIKAGRRRLVVGPRSVLFAPAENVGLIVVDEEHDEAYLQTESPAYDARLGARLKAVEHGSLVVYGSDIPTVEAFHRARTEGHLLALAGEGAKKNVIIIDDRSERALLARKLEEGLRRNLEAGRPSLVFLNRRGYASFLFCPRCSHIPRCDRCDIPLAYYKKEGKLVCRYCSSSRPASASCPRCGSRVMEPRGIGVEAVEEELHRLFPQARVSSFDSDRVKTKAAREKILRNFQEGRVDILTGTQMLARRTELPPVSLIGILNPEALLAFSDFRASQKTFEVICRMMRFSAPAGSEIVIQTAFPDHYSLREAVRQDYPAFFDQEIQFRRLMNYPPFSAMAEVCLLGQDRRRLAQRARELIGRIRAFSRDIEILGPAVAAPTLHRGEKGIQVILKSREGETLEACLAECLRTISARKSVVRYD